MQDEHFTPQNYNSELVIGSNRSTQSVHFLFGAFLQCTALAVAVQSLAVSYWMTD